MPRRRDKSRQINYLDNVPSRAIDHEEGDDGRLTLLRPKFTRGPLAWWLQPRMKYKYFKVRLDDIGTATWQAIDGERSVGQIADLLYEEFGERIEPRYDRLSQFIDTLARSSMVTLERSVSASKE
jgi:hypothetical protein